MADFNMDNSTTDISPKCFFDFDKASLEAYLLSINSQKFRAKQIFDYVYTKFIFDFSKMSSLPTALRQKLAQDLYFTSAKLVANKKSKEDAGKFLFELNDGYFIESVILTAPTENNEEKKTICVSTQVGCAQSCRFCASTLNGFKRNLSYQEILTQFITFSKENQGFDFENVVVMGMGEPMANADNLLKALSIINKDFSFGARRITVSSCGLANKIEEMAKLDFPYRLAISLHATNDEIRNQIMPVNKRFPLDTLLKSLEIFSKTSKRMIGLEYILIDNMNNSIQDAKALAKIAKKLKAHVNLIPYNTVEGLDWQRPPTKNSQKFLDVLKSMNISATLRREKGSDIDAACGQLALKKNKGA
ncbi:MAG: 23S rRNA (adenine(2503)-C(2))-methyltransferase RlmN [Opitutales bacterium]